ncbi:MAG: hypothetical protein EPN94_09570 [Nitrospirae bacterium]|nr:MAG: hypothetical protein EPN94_09570 [Nitrospirota bacterium]
MKQLFRLLVIGLVGAFLLSGCAKAPTVEMNDTKASVESATNADTQTYAKDALAKLTSDLEAANTEVQTQDKKFLFKNFDKAKQMLAAVKTDAEAVKAEAAKKKEEAKQAAIAAQGEAKAAIDAANALLAEAPTGKETKQDIEAFKADLTGLTDSLTGLQQSIDQEKYADASANAAAIKEKAANISAQITAALEKVKAKRGGRK